ncbi:unnamed protein product [Cuscuta campestris]|uniref:Replication factor A C-terminal domain-containing protein n=1 Tax=Cuscuta campestris TaxID=132261 RepID=A0A484LJG7_9ASTE|nr:unnamed protein product [Cuscuta campestris]
MTSSIRAKQGDGSYVVYGTIVAVNNESDWWYLACKCNRAVKPDGAMYYCAYCSNRVFKAGSFENPREFDDLLLGKTYIFKVEVRVMNRGQHEHSFRVSKVCHDDTIKKKYLESIHANNSKAASNRAVPVYSVEEEFLNRTLARTIESLKDCTEDGEYAVYGTIKGVDGGVDWFIPTCRCGSEVIPRNGFYYCSDCKKCVVNVIPRYRIKARVNDASDSATFVIFESLGCLLLHKSCSKMLKLSEVEVKTANINDFEPSYNVIDICFNDRIIAKFMEMHSSFFSPQTDKTIGYSTDGKTNTEVISVGNATSCVKNLIVDFFESQDSHLTQPRDDVINLTPMKRMQEEVYNVGDGDDSVKKMRSVKIEKN